MNLIDIVLLVVNALFWAIVTGVVAANKGRNVLVWVTLALIFGPFALLVAAVVPANQVAIDAEALHAGEMKRCPFCAELVKSEAVLCRYCGRSLPDNATAVGAAPRAVPSSRVVDELMSLRTAYSAWESTREPRLLDAFLTALRVTGPLLSQVGMSASDVSQEFSAAAGLGDFQAIIGTLGNER